MAYYIKPCIEWLNRLGELGFAFFLGAKVPISIVELYVDFSRGILMRIVGWSVDL